MMGIICVEDNEVGCRRAEVIAHVTFKLRGALSLSVISIPSIR